MQNVDLETAGQSWLLHLNELKEIQQNTYKISIIYKDKTKAWHNKHIEKKEFHPGQQVLLFNSSLKLFMGNLKSRWFGPFMITQVFPYGSVELAHLEKGNFKVNGQRLKPYFWGQHEKSKSAIGLKPS